MRNASEVAGLLCPVCRVGLAMSERQGIEIDYCPQCRGVWLDRGELDKIIERNSADATPAQSGRPGGAPQQAPLHPGSAQSPWQPGGFTHGGHGHGQPYGEHKRRKHKHWLEELFD
jgi:Zn-finger nucleic acid-binding protein